MSGSIPLLGTKFIPMKYRYFISYWAECNSDNPKNGLFQFDFCITANNKALRKAEAGICKKMFGDKREIKILFFQKL